MIRNYLILFFALIVLDSRSLFATDCAILLHGLGRSQSAMSDLAVALERAGYTTVNKTYPSTKYRIEKLADDAIAHALGACPKKSKINFVSHSLGGILIREYLSKNNIDNLGRVVMLAPPNKGSEIADKLSLLPQFKKINIPAALQLGTSRFSVPNRLGPAHFSLGIIAGTRSINPILSQVLPNPDDGKVSVESTKLAGMDDHIALPVTHTFMMRNKTVIAQVLFFLKKGRFNKG